MTGFDPQPDIGELKFRSAAVSCCSWVCSEAREASGSETARIHYAARRRGGVGGEPIGRPQLEAEILVLRQPHLM
jgi:hypothetical protein